MIFAIQFSQTWTDILLSSSSLQRQYALAAECARLWRAAALEDLSAHRTSVVSHTKRPALTDRKPDVAMPQQLPRNRECAGQYSFKVKDTAGLVLYLPFQHRDSDPVAGRQRILIEVWAV